MSSQKPSYKYAWTWRREIPNILNMLPQDFTDRNRLSHYLHAKGCGTRNDLTTEVIGIWEVIFQKLDHCIFIYNIYTHASNIWKLFCSLLIQAKDRSIHLICCKRKLRWLAKKWIMRNNWKLLHGSSLQACTNIRQDILCLGFSSLVVNSFMTTNGFLWTVDFHWDWIDTYPFVGGANEEWMSIHRQAH